MSGFGFISSSWQAYGTSGNYYDKTSGSVSIYTSSTIFPGSDLAITCPQCGVYLINGSSSSSSHSNPVAIPCSFYDLNYIAADGIDDGFLVYPNFGIKVYTGTGFSGSQSTILFNAFTAPLFFSTSGNASFSDASTYVYYNDGTQWTTANTVHSIQVFYQGTIINVIPFNSSN